MNANNKIYQKEIYCLIQEGKDLIRSKNVNWFYTQNPVIIFKINKSEVKE